MPLYHFSPPAPAPGWRGFGFLFLSRCLSRRSFLLPPTLFLVQRLLRFLRRRGLSGSPGFFLCPSCLPGTLCTLSFPACICHLSHASNISHVSAVPPVSQNTASRRLLFSFYILIISFSIPKFREKSNAFLKFSHVCSTFFSDFH